VNRPTAQILLVEDNPGDVLLVQEALKEARVGASLHVCRDGVDALDYLRHGARNGETGLPDLVLLDLNMPRMSGHELLAEVKGHPVLGRIPVVVLSTSTSEGDIRATYELHANSYVAKPLDLEMFMQAVRDIASYWLELSQPC
jgi:two-component system response regulator